MHNKVLSIIQDENVSNHLNLPEIVRNQDDQFVWKKIMASLRSNLSNISPVKGDIFKKGIGYANKQDHYYYASSISDYFCFLRELTACRSEGKGRYKNGKVAL